MLQKKVEQVDRSEVLHASNYFLSADSTTKESGKRKVEVRYQTIHILVRATAPVINIAKTSRTRNAKKSHLFFWKQKLINNESDYTSIRTTTPPKGKIILNSDNQKHNTKIITKSLSFL